MPERRSSDGYLVGVADAQASSTAPASNTTSTASRRALQQTPARSGRCLATDGRAPASAVVDPLVPASRSPPAQASLDVSARERRRSSDAYGCFCRSASSHALMALPSLSASVGAPMLRSCGRAFSARLRQLRAGQGSVGKTLVNDALERVREPLRIVHHAVVETERLLVKIAEQMERFDRHVGTLDGALQEAPEVLAAIGVDFAVHVGFGVVDHAMGVVGVQPVIRQEKVSVDLRTATDVRADVGLQSVLTNVARDGKPYHAVTVFIVARAQSHHGNLTGDTPAGLDVQPTPFVGVHEARFATDVSLVGF